MLAVRIVLGVEGIEAAHSFKNASSLGEGNGLDASCDHNGAADESRTQLIVQSAQALSCCGHGRSLSIWRGGKIRAGASRARHEADAIEPPVAAEMAFKPLVRGAGNAALSRMGNRVSGRGRPSPAISFRCSPSDAGGRRP